MVIGIIIGILVVYGIVCFMGGALKKILEVISLIARFLLCGSLAYAIFQLLPFAVSGWGSVLVFFIGGCVIFALIATLASAFRLAAYSVNYFITSLIVFFMIQVIAGGKMDFLPFILIQFLFPRILWISDRFATQTNYDHTEFGLFRNTDVYITKAVDW